MRRLGGVMDEDVCASKAKVKIPSIVELCAFDVSW
jgi:hypothetical protein